LVNKKKGGRNAPTTKENKMIVEIIAYSVFIIFFWEMVKKVVQEWIQ